MFFWKGCLSQSGDPQQREAKKLPTAHPAGLNRRLNLYPRIAPDLYIYIYITYTYTYTHTHTHTHTCIPSSFITKNKKGNNSLHKNIVLSRPYKPKLISNYCLHFQCDLFTNASKKLYPVTWFLSNNTTSSILFAILDTE